MQPEQPKGATTGRYLLHFQNADKVQGKADTTPPPPPPSSDHFTPVPLPVLSLSADTSDMQFTWVSNLESSGVTLLPVLEDHEELVRNATSIFDFEAKDIDGNVVCLDKYRYDHTLFAHVTVM